MTPRARPVVAISMRSAIPPGAVAAMGRTLAALVGVVAGLVGIPVASAGAPSGEPLYVCPPCVADCHHLRFPGPGSCPVCRMALVEATDADGSPLFLVDAAPGRATVDTTGGAEVGGEVTFAYRDLRIPAGDVTLEARLYRPSGAREPLPAAVVNHGSAPTTFADVSFFTRTCLEAGLAVLAYSKRGCGGSTGRYRRFTVRESADLFDALADDAAAAFRHLVRAPGIDPTRVGFVGGSQAGWISPLAASRVDAAFVVNVAGAPVSAGMEAHHGRLVGEGNDVFRQVPTAVADSLLRHFDGPPGYDPAPTLAALETPVLWIFGTRDEVIPVTASLDALADLRRAGHRNHHVVIADGHTHDLVHVDTGRPFDLRSALGSWLVDQGILPDPRAPGGAR